MTEQARAAVPDLATIRALEERLLDPAVRRSSEAVASLLLNDFVEFGRSGAVYDKEATIDALAAETGRTHSELTAYGYKLTLLGKDAVLLTYRTIRTQAESEGLHTLRSSVWVWTGNRWQMAFHQGTATGPGV